MSVERVAPSKDGFGIFIWSSGERFLGPKKREVLATDLYLLVLISSENS